MLLMARRLGFGGTERAVACGSADTLLSQNRASRQYFGHPLKGIAFGTHRRRLTSPHSMALAKMTARRLERSGA
jgi:hypothetical protein